MIWSLEGIANRRRSIGRRAAVSLTIAALLLAWPAPEQRPAARILVGPNVLMNSLREGVYNEPWVAASPTNARHLLAGATLSNRMHDGGSEDRGFYSRDGGNTWRMITFPEAVASSSWDPQTAFTRTGTALFTTIVNDSVLVYRSADSGMTWAPPVNLGHGDHEMIAADHGAGPFTGRAYLGMLRSNRHGGRDYHIEVFRSSDDGRTWSGPIDVADNHGDSSMVRQVLNLLVLADGRLVVPILNFKAIQDHRDRDFISFATSVDGGMTFSAATPGRMKDGGEFRIPAGSFSDYPMFAVDRSSGPRRGRLYAVFPDRSLYPNGSRRVDTLSFGARYRARGIRIVRSYSDDLGLTWSKPVAVAPGEAGIGDQFSAMPAVNDEGTVAITWYDTRETPPDVEGGPLIRRYVTASLDGGATFLPPKPVASAPTDLLLTLERSSGPTAIGSMLSIAFPRTAAYRTPTGGDYWAFTAAADGSFHAVWTDGRTGSHQLWTARVIVQREAASGGRGRKTGGTPLSEETDVSNLLQVVLDPVSELAPPGTVEVPVRLKNKSAHRIYGPLRVGVAYLNGVLLNAANGRSDTAATMDYSRALGDFEALEPGAVTEAVIWRFKVPTGGGRLPSVGLEVFARLDSAGRQAPAMR